MKISVIIPTFNEQDSILECLSSLEGQSLKDFEVIVIDDGSIDETQKILKGYKASYYVFSYFVQKHSGPGAARNFAAKKAKRKIPVFLL